MTILIEACVDSLESALAAAKGGAHRLELCANLTVGGTTPPPDLIAEVRAGTPLPIMAMIRPRGGSYVHSRAELAQMRTDIDMATVAGADGVVLGVLDGGNRVDVERTRELVLAAGNRPVVFHRAFDLVPDLERGLESLVAAGISRVLTSGGAPNALAGAEMLATLVRLGGDRIAVMAGGKVRGPNVRELVAKTGVREVHARCKLDESQIRAIAAAL